MALTKMINGKSVTLTTQEENAVRAEWAANKIKQDKARLITDAFDAQIESEKVALPTWAQVKTAIENAFTNTAQASIIKKIARPVYTNLKKIVV